MCCASTRGWPEEAWDAAVESLRGRGWLETGDELRFTEWGAAQRQEIEDGTDALAAAPYAVLGEERCAELRSPGPALEPDVRGAAAPLSGP